MTDEGERVGEIKAIETAYKGYRFRSRLEARWAVFFDALDIKWHYEEEGYELPSGRYLPDFRLEKMASAGTRDIWAEVKGKPTSADVIKTFNAAAELACEPGAADGGMPLPRLLLLSDIPEPGEAWTHLQVCRSREWLVIQWVHFAWCAYNESRGWGDITLDPHLRHTPAVSAAYKAARSARFEFGESGAPSR
jgi:hypothetical protein